MRFSKYTFFLFCILFSVVTTRAQNDAKSLLRAVYNNLQKAKDYKVEAHIKVDVPLIRILPINVEIYFKQKDKFKVKSKGIAIVPREGFMQASKLLADTNSYATMIQGEEKTDSFTAVIVNVIPLSDTGNLILGKLWIDELKKVILKSQFTTKSNGTIETQYFYGNEVEYGLPDKMIFTVDVQKFKIPKKFSNNSSSETSKKGSKDKKGKIYITLKNYQVNKGIPDSEFNK